MSTVASVLAAEPGWLYPSIVTPPGSVSIGSALAGVIWRTPSPGMAKVIVLFPDMAFASSMAARNVQTPAPVAHTPSSVASLASAVDLTTKVPGGGAGSQAAMTSTMTAAPASTTIPRM